MIRVCLSSLQNCTRLVTNKLHTKGFVVHAPRGRCRRPSSPVLVRCPRPQPCWGGLRTSARANARRQRRVRAAADPRRRSAQQAGQRAADRGGCCLDRQVALRRVGAGGGAQRACELLAHRLVLAAQLRGGLDAVALAVLAGAVTAAAEAAAQRRVRVRHARVQAQAACGHATGMWWQLGRHRAPSSALAARSSCRRVSRGSRESRHRAHAPVLVGHLERAAAEALGHAVGAHLDQAGHPAGGAAGLLQLARLSVACVQAARRLTSPGAVGGLPARPASGSGQCGPPAPAARGRHRAGAGHNVPHPSHLSQPSARSQPPARPHLRPGS